MARNRSSRRPLGDTEISDRRPGLGREEHPTAMHLRASVVGGDHAWASRLAARQVLRKLH
eukprot:554074-Lingulodinium_polyedra.AAC.1